MSKEQNGDFYPAPVVDHVASPGPVARLIIFMVVLSVTGVAFVLFRGRLGEPFLLGFLGILAMIGVGYLFATAIGVVRVSSRSPGDDLSKAFIDTMGEGLVVTDAKERVVYANRSYAELTGATSVSDIKTVRGLLSDNAEAHETISRLTTSVGDGKSGDGEFRLFQAVRPGAEPGARWYRVGARIFQAPGHRRPLQAWTIR